MTNVSATWRAAYGAWTQCCHGDTGDRTMSIRTYRPGDESAQVAIYTEAAAELPKFKPATVEEIGRRCRAAEFDPSTRFYAEPNGEVVGYASFHANGRIGFPWCRKGHDDQAEPLFQRVLQAMQERRIPTAF